MGSLEFLREETETFPIQFDNFVTCLKDEGDITGRVHEMRILKGGTLDGDCKDKLTYLRVNLLTSSGSVKKVKQLLEKMFEVGAEREVASVPLLDTVTLGYQVSVDTVGTTEPVRKKRRRLPWLNEEVDKEVDKCSSRTR